MCAVTVDDIDTLLDQPAGEHLLSLTRCRLPVWPPVERGNDEVRVVFLRPCERPPDRLAGVTGGGVGSHVGGAGTVCRGRVRRVPARESDCRDGQRADLCHRRGERGRQTRTGPRVCDTRLREVAACALEPWFPEVENVVVRERGDGGVRGPECRHREPGVCTEVVDLLGPAASALGETALQIQYEAVERLESLQGRPPHAGRVAVDPAVGHTPAQHDVADEPDGGVCAPRLELGPRRRPTPVSTPCQCYDARRQHTPPGPGHLSPDTRREVSTLCPRTR